MTNSDSLVASSHASLAAHQQITTVGALEQALLAHFPKESAEPWDKTGLLVGDPRQVLSGIAIALDPTLQAIHAASRIGANVLLTHHPVFLDAPDSFLPPSSDLQMGALVYEAIRHNLALMNFHTALDVSLEAQQMLPGMLSLEFQEVFEPISCPPPFQAAPYNTSTTARSGVLGYGQLCTPLSDDMPLTLGDLALRCAEVFGRSPRVWGNQGTQLYSVVTTTGASGSLPSQCCKRGVDCLICGEVKYHTALNAAQTGLGIIELGHDVSELPFTQVLAETVQQLGIAEDKIAILNQNSNWSLPERA